jgi:hypothetical protein
VVAPSMLVKDHTVLAPIASLELCTDYMSDFMGPDKSQCMRASFV